VEIRVHDVGAQEPPGEGFDLVHARLVLVHVPDRDRALRSMIQALRPGGWLLVEDADPALQPLTCPDESGPEQRLANRLRQGFRGLLAERGADLAYGRRLPRLLREAGLHEVEADGFFPMTSPACTALEAATVRQIRDRLIDAGLATAEEIEQHLANVEAGDMDLTTAPMISAWGRKA
jgi:SAM-dependent methyltransferase